MQDPTAFWDAFERLRNRLDTDPAPELAERLRRLARTVRRGDPQLARQRLALLENLARRHRLDLRDPAAPPPGAALRVLVSGIGRSSTTLIYQQFAKLFLLETERVNFRYEPYLWDIRTPQTEGNGFGADQYHHFGLHTHLETPLFLTGAHPLHDRFLDTLWAAPWDRNAGQAAEIHLAKVIRGSGRLRAYLARYPDLRLVICLRNPLDTINSSLGMFSFFGEEFHKDDRARFRDEAAAADRLRRALPEASPNAVDWHGAWWRAFTEESLAVAAERPDRTYLFCHERFQRAPDEVLGELEAFAGLANPGTRMGLSRPAGPSIRATSLTGHDLGRLREDADWYRETVLEGTLGHAAAAETQARLMRKYASGRFSWPVAGSDLGQRSSIQLRALMLSGGSTPFFRLATGPRASVDLDALIEAHAGVGAEALRLPAPDPARLRRGRSFGAVVTCHDNAATIADAVLSCLNQTLPFDEIVVVDDASRDASRERLAELARLYASLRIVHLDSRVGPAAARDIGIRRLGTDYVTQLDGDDQFWPTKTAEEARALSGDLRALAFSDILLVLPERSLLQDCTGYAGTSGPDLFALLLARRPQIPRDMTLPRRLYLEAGGYDLVSHLYEDWDFKLRLAALEGVAWRRAEGRAGTVYNRLRPGLSGVEDGAHARALTLIFLRALRHRICPPDRLTEAFDAALGRFGDRHIARAARAFLDARPGEAGLAEVAELAAARRLHALGNVEIAALLEERTRSLRPEAEALSA